MNTSKSLNCLACICLVLLLITSQAHSATTAKPTTSSVPVSVLNCPQGPPTPGVPPQYGGILKILFRNNVTNIGTPWKTIQAADGQA